MPKPIFPLLLALVGCAASNSAPVSGPETVTYRTVDGASLSATVFAAAEASDSDVAVLLFHGGAYFTGTPQSTWTVAQALSAAGIPAVAIQYRLSDGTITPIEALDDACAAVEWVQSYGGVGRPSRIVLYGESAGAHLAANLVTHGCDTEVARPAALLLDSPSLDAMAERAQFEQLLAGRAEVKDHAPMENMDSPLPPVAIVHGEADDRVPIAQSETFCDLQRSLGGTCVFRRVPDRGHLHTRSLHQQIPGPGFDPDMSARAESNAFFIGFLREQGLLEKSCST